MNAIFLKLGIGTTQIYRATQFRLDIVAYTFGIVAVVFGLTHQVIFHNSKIEGKNKCRLSWNLMHSS